MVCKDAQELIHGYVDGELDRLGNLEVERHLEGCDLCSEVYRRALALHSRMQDPALKFKAPEGVRRGVESSVRKSERTGTGWWGWLSFAASVAALAGVIWIAAAILRPPGQELIAQEVVSSHVRSLMADHLTDIPTSDQHTVKPWFNGRLDFSPPVKDLTVEGFTLVGGRMDYLGQTPAAAVIYRRRQHVINLFVWPAGSERATAMKVESRRGYNLIHWTQSGLAFWAVSDLNSGELQEFARSVSR